MSRLRPRGRAAKRPAKKRDRANAHQVQRAARKKELQRDGTLCAYCGKPFTPKGPEVTCSPECAKEYKRIQHGMAAYRGGWRKHPPSHTRYSSGLPQSSVVGVNYNRSLQKWQVTHKRKYIGVYASQAEAEAVKRELDQSDAP